METPGASAVEQLFEGFVRAFNAKDLEALRACYANDALVLPPGQPPFRGADAIIEELWRPTFEAYDVDSELPIEEIQVSADLGFVRGTYALRLEPVGGGEAMREKGRFIDVVSGDADGGWKISRAIWNVTG